MSTLEKLIQLEKEADQFGFKWETALQIIDQIRSECDEIVEHLNQGMNQNKKELQMEIGDLMHAVFSLCVFCQFDPERTLKDSVDKFERRFNAVKTISAQKGLATLNGLSFSQLMAIWDEAKSLE